jgi:hypothetical protein
MNKETEESGSESVDAALRTAATHYGVRLSGPAKYGWGRKSMGSMAQGADGIWWLRVHFMDRREEPGRQWNGVLESREIPGVNKPQVRDSYDWQTATHRWRAELLSYVDSQVCSATPELRTTLDLPESWYRTLRSSLDALAAYETGRINTRQDLISRRINEAYSAPVDTTVKIWTTVHGDIHWANLTAPDCWILDWETWGKGPLGLDAAFLYCFSLLEPRLAEAIFRCFEDQLSTDDGIRSQLFVCAELRRMATLYGDHPDLVTKLDELSLELLRVK